MSKLLPTFFPHCATLLQPLQDILLPSKIALPIWTNATIQASANTIHTSHMLHRVKDGAPTGLLTDASEVAIEPVAQQFEHGEWKRLLFFSRKLTGTERRYSTSCHELLFVYPAICRFQYVLVAQPFYMLTEPLEGAIQSLKPDSRYHFLRKLREIPFFSELATDTGT